MNVRQWMIAIIVAFATYTIGSIALGDSPWFLRTGSDKLPVSASVLGGSIDRYVDPDNGVTCYVVRHPAASPAISCIQVRGPNKEGVER